jgi:mannose-6-phosphate isomerase-like protein (cupin superfamily)
VSYTYRRVVTGHNAAGKAIVVRDSKLSMKELRAGADASVVWTTKGFPVDNDDPADGAERVVRTSEIDGTVFRIVRYAPGVVPCRHRTDSIDYALVLSGSIDMDLDDETVHLEARDILVQRGTIHNRINRGTEPCVIAFVLIGAKPATASGKQLSEIG